VADVTLLDISKGVRDSWTNAGSSLTNIIPLTKLYFKRIPSGTSAPTLPYVVFEFKDVSAYFGGTEYFSGSAYVKATQVTFRTYFNPVDFDARAYATILNDKFGWGATNAAGSWTIPNATVLAAMPEVEASDLTEETIDGKDINIYESTFTVKMQADRG
jgi:hypothetical protein